MKHKLLLWGAFLLMTHAVLFVAGSVRGQNITLEYYTEEFLGSDAQVGLAHYSIYRDIANYIKTQKNTKAQ